MEIHIIIKGYIRNTIKYALTPAMIMAKWMNVREVDFKMADIIKVDIIRLNTNILIY